MNIVIHDIRQQGPIGAIYGPLVCGEGMTFDQDETKLITASWRGENQLQIYDLRTNKLLNDIKWQHPKLSETQTPMLFTCASKTNWASSTNVLIAAGSRKNEC